MTPAAHPYLPLTWQGLPEARHDGKGFSAQPEAELKQLTFYIYIDSENRFRPNALVLSYAKFPIISLTFHLITLLSVSGILAYVYFGVETIHPYALFWLAVAATGMSIVIGKAAGEFSGRQG